MRVCTSHNPLPTGNLSGLSFPPKPSSFYRGQPGPSENEIREWEDRQEEGVDGGDIDNGANGSIRGLGITLIVSVFIMNVEIDI